MPVATARREYPAVLPEQAGEGSESAGIDRPDWSAALGVAELNAAGTRQAIAPECFGSSITPLFASPRWRISSTAFPPLCRHQGPDSGHAIICRSILTHSGCRDTTKIPP